MKREVKKKKTKTQRERKEKRKKMKRNGKKRRSDRVAGNFHRVKVTVPGAGYIPTAGSYCSWDFSKAGFFGPVKDLILHPKKKRRCFDLSEAVVQR